MVAQQQKQMSFQDALNLNQQQQKQQQLDLMSLMAQNSLSSGSAREVGVIEKIMVFLITTNELPVHEFNWAYISFKASYGFIKALNNGMRLFFHYSSYIGGDVNQLKIGDLIQYEASVDRRTNKPIALNIVKCEPQQKPTSNQNLVNDNYFISALNSNHQKQQNIERLSDFMLGNIVSLSKIQQNLNVNNFRENPLILIFNRNHA